MRTYYGFEHAYGEDKGDSDGNDLGTAYAFDSKAGRNAWVAARWTDDHSQAGYRTTYPASKARKLGYINHADRAMGK